MWQSYRYGGDLVARDQLVLSCAPLVKYLVDRKLRSIPARCEVDDFISVGLEALIGALDRFQPERGASLEQYLWTRVNGAILDELRRQDWAPRSLRRLERRVQGARDDFHAREGRPPSGPELAGALGLSHGELRRHQESLHSAIVGSLNVAAPGGDPGDEAIDRLVSHDDTADPERAAALDAATDQFRRAFASLRPRERQVAVLLYVHDFTLREIGQVLGVSESRVCQLHAELKRSLRARLSGSEPLFADVA